MPEAAGAPAGGAGFSGTVGRPVSGGGFGGGRAALSGLVAGAPEDGGGGIAGREGGIGGVLPEAGAEEAAAAISMRAVSFFGALTSGWLVVPGTLMRTVSRLTAGDSDLGGNVMRIVSFFVESSSWGAFAEGFSSAIK